MTWVSLIIREKCLSVKNYCDIVPPLMHMASSFSTPPRNAFAVYAYAWRYWLNRRGGRKMTWRAFGRMMAAYPLLRPRIVKGWV